MINLTNKHGKHLCNVIKWIKGNQMQLQAHVRCDRERTNGKESVKESKREKERERDFETTRRLEVEKLQHPTGKKKKKNKSFKTRPEVAEPYKSQPSLFNYDSLHLFIHKRLI